MLETRHIHQRPRYRDVGSVLSIQEIGCTPCLHKVDIAIDSVLSSVDSGFEGVSGLAVHIT